MAPLGNGSWVRNGIRGVAGEEPDFKLGGLSLWIHGWEREASQDFWDAN